MADNNPYSDDNSGQPTPGFSSWFANLMPTRDGMVNFTSDVLGTPVEGPAWALRQMVMPISWKMAPDPIQGGKAMYAGPDVPFGSLWFRNAINNPGFSASQFYQALRRAHGLF